MTDDFEALTEEEIEDELEGELRETPAPDLPEWATSRIVVVYGREFAIEPPTIGITLRIINCFGNLLIRGEKVAVRALQSLSRGTKGQSIQPSQRAALYGMLAAINVEDLYSLGAAVLQFPEDRKGRAWLRQAPDGQDIPLSPVIRAMFLNIAQSADLKDALADFFDGLGILDEFLEGIDLGV